VDIVSNLEQCWYSVFGAHDEDWDPDVVIRLVSLLADPLHCQSGSLLDRDVRQSRYDPSAVSQSASASCIGADILGFGVRMKLDLDRGIAISSEIYSCVWCWDRTHNRHIRNRHVRSNVGNNKVFLRRKHALVILATVTKADVLVKFVIRIKILAVYATSLKYRNKLFRTNMESVYYGQINSDLVIVLDVLISRFLILLDLIINLVRQIPVFIII